MSENPNIEKLFQKENVNGYWKKLHDSGMGPPLKSIAEWKKFRIDQKRYVRKKTVQHAQNKNKTGGPCKEYAFTVLEQSILDLTETIESVEGVDGGRVFSLKASLSNTIDNNQCEISKNEECDVVTDKEDQCFFS